MKIGGCSDVSKVRIQSNCGDELCMRARGFSLRCGKSSASITEWLSLIKLNL